MNSDLDLLSAIQRTSFAIVASECFQAYDHILTLHEETQFVWTASWGIGKLLYFLTRYSPYVNTVVSIWAYLGPSPMPDRLCNTLIKIDGWACVFGLLIAETIMVLRVWAMWSQSRKCGCLLFVLAATFVTIGCIMFAVFAQNTSARNSDSSLRGCRFTFETNTTYISFLLLMTFEIIMLILTVIKGLRDLGRKPKCSSSSFMFKLYRDGVVYYTVVAGISFANVMVLLFANPHFAIILVAPQRCVHSVFSARILLRLREDACRREREQLPATLYTAPVGNSIFVSTNGSRHVSTMSTSTAHQRRMYENLSVGGRRTRGRGSAWFGDADSNVISGISGSSSGDESSSRS